MATIKSFTDVTQSKVLAEFLPLESADMYWWSSGKRYYIEAIDDDDYDEDKDIRAWSLAALLEIIRNDGRYELQMYEGGYYFESGEFMTESYFNPIDACVEMIIKLHEQNLL